MKNILLTIEYDGTNFHGWQRQPDEITVQGHLERVLGRLLCRQILLNGTSRTDGGVHAYGQRASFTADINIPVEKLALVANNSLAACEKGSFALTPIRILKAEEKPLDFHARFDAKGKKYIYKIRNLQDVDIFKRNYVYQVTEPLNVEAMREAAKELVGIHDFKSFEASGSSQRESTVRTIFSLEVMEEDGFVELHISGDGFLYNMVRIITGTLVDIGLGRITAVSMKEIIETKDRSRAGHTAPPYGLYLAEVYY
ncbi:MAG: tRNA pseudouridine(38-40) synthase TruA [Clostridiales bacterium]|nr:tRNA pseudouridine(38-40) synthase TruA [Clostridiales bacterium]